MRQMHRCDKHKCAVELSIKKNEKGAHWAIASHPFRFYTVVASADADTDTDTDTDTEVALGVFQDRPHRAELGQFQGARLLQKVYLQKQTDRSADSQKRLGDRARAVPKE